jgi:hypothetical protein
LVPSRSAAAANISALKECHRAFVALDSAYHLALGKLPEKELQETLSGRRSPEIAAALVEGAREGVSVANIKRLAGQTLIDRCLNVGESSALFRGAPLLACAKGEAASYYKARHKPVNRK